MNDSDWDDHDSETFCKHWYTPSDCDALCKCGHKCCEHVGDGECTHDYGGCSCEEFRDSAESTAAIPDR
jgi:hypothetical protein